MQQRRISIVGVGSGGCKVIDSLTDVTRRGPTLVAIDTDSSALADSRATAKLQIGSDLTKGHGTGCDVVVGRRAATDDIEMIRNLLVDKDLVLLVVGLGGGTGTGSASVIMDTAREAGATSLCFATLPFDFEGKERVAEAEKAIPGLRASADALIVVPNKRLFEAVGKSNLVESFAKADQVLGQAISAIWKMIVTPGYISLDLAKLRKVVQGSRGTCSFGYGSGRGDSRCEEAIKSLLDGPLLDSGKLMASSTALLVSIVGSTDLTLQEVEDIMKAVSARAGPETSIFMGTAIDDECDDVVSVAVIASERGEDISDSAESSPAEPSVIEPIVAEPVDFDEPEEAQKQTKKKRRRMARQTKLRLDTTGRGRFKDIEPTILDGEDLDIPTFIRRGIPIEK